MIFGDSKRYVIIIYDDLFLYFLNYFHYLDYEDQVWLSFSFICWYGTEIFAMVVTRTLLFVFFSCLQEETLTNGKNTHNWYFTHSSPGTTELIIHRFVFTKFIELVALNHLFRLLIMMVVRSMECDYNSSFHNYYSVLLWSDKINYFLRTSFFCLQSVSFP